MPQPRCVAHLKILLSQSHTAASPWAGAQYVATQQSVEKETIPKLAQNEHLQGAQLALPYDLPDTGHSQHLRATLSKSNALDAFTAGEPTPLPPALCSSTAPGKAPSGTGKAPSPGKQFPSPAGAGAFPVVLGPAHQVPGPAPSSARRASAA